MDKQTWGFSILLIIVLFLGTAMIMELNHSIHQAPETTADKERITYENACSASMFGGRVGVPNTSEKPWTCIIPNGTTK